MRNFVAKNAGINRAVTHKNKKFVAKQGKRKQKHKNKFGY